MKGFIKALLSAGVGLLTAALLPITASAYTLENHTVDEIRAWHQAHPTDADAVTYANPPVLTKPMIAGRLSDQTEQQTLNAINLCRYIAGLPADVQFNEEYVQQAQAASLCNAVNGTLSHEPKCPKGMDNPLYQLAYTGAGSSNLSFGYATPMQAVMLGQIYDSDASNIRSLGHRRWILNPDMAFSGAGITKDYTAVYAFDTSRTEQFTGDYIAWPPANMPYELYKEPTAYYGGKEWYAFSVTLGPEYDKANIKNVTVNLTSKKLGKTFKFTQANTKDSYFLNVSTGGFGIPNCIIFNPGKLFDIDDQLTVKITGITKKGKSAPITYSVKYFQLNQPAGQSDKPKLEGETVTVKPGSKKVSARVTLTNNPGITALDVGISYFPKLSLAAPGGCDQIHPGSLSPFGIETWYMGANAGIRGSLDSGLLYTKTGELFYVDFDVPADLEPGTYEMKIKVNQMLGKNGKPLDVETVNGCFIIPGAETSVPETTAAPPVTTVTATTTAAVKKPAIIIADRITGVQGAKALPYTIVIMENPGYSKISIRMDVNTQFAALNPTPKLISGSATPNTALTWSAGSGAVIGLTAEGGENITDIGTLLVYEVDIPEEMTPGRYDMTIHIDLLSDTDGKPLEYELYGGWIDIEEPPRYAGDVNCDGKCSIADAVWLGRLTVEDATLSVKNRGISNADCDGVEGLDIGDVVALLRFLAGTVEQLI